MVNTGRRLNDGLMTGYLRRRWPNMMSKSGGSVVGDFVKLQYITTLQRFTLPRPVNWVSPWWNEVVHSQNGTFNRCWFNVGPPSATVAQHWTNILRNVWLWRSCITGPVHQPLASYRHSVGNPSLSRGPSHCISQLTNNCTRIQAHYLHCLINLDVTVFGA